MKIELLQGEWQEDLSETINKRIARIRGRFDRIYRENSSKMFAERFPLIVESIAMEFSASVTCNGDTYLLNFLELYDGKIFKDADIPWEVAEGFRECPACKGEAIQCAAESKGLNEAIQKYESFHGESIAKADFLFELSESLEAYQEYGDYEETHNIKLATEWVDKWFYYFNVV